jgi:hypothetical protein
MEIFIICVIIWLLFGLIANVLYIYDCYIDELNYVIKDIFFGIFLLLFGFVSFLVYMDVLKIIFKKFLNCKFFDKVIFDFSKKNK